MSYCMNTVLRVLLWFEVCLVTDGAILRNRGTFDVVDHCRVFCYGDLLHAIQLADIFEDSKDFVDMPLRYNPEYTLQAFHTLQNKSDPDELRQFVAQFFLPPGNELEECDPNDWNPRPDTFSKILDPIYRKWALQIHSKWKPLCRKVKAEVLEAPERYSLIPLPYPFIVPGGRFREFYYWDTYWIIKGLLRSEMFQMAKYMLLNLLETVKQFGFVPNGGRIYYLRRSQPPLLIPAVFEYFKATKDIDFIKTALPLLEDEYRFFETNRNVTWYNKLGESFQLFQYRVEQDAPRPESYKEDIATAEHATLKEHKVQIWSDIASACESGWDFSSRWFAKQGRHKNSIKGIRTSKIIPVDLNSFMVMNAEILADMFHMVGDGLKAKEYSTKHDTLGRSLMKLFWNDTDGTWYDLDLETGQQSAHFYASNLIPLFAKEMPNDYYHERSVEYLINSQAASVLGGLPTSLTFINEQWDYPNGWASTNHIVIEGLRYSDEPTAQDMAFELAQKWVTTNYLAYVESGGKMFEKYDIQSGVAGGGGEYEVQEGFGWSNGVILDLLVTYGDRLTSPSSAHPEPLDDLMDRIQGENLLNLGAMESDAFQNSLPF